MLSPLSGGLWAQHWEVGGSAGYGLYRDVAVSAGAVSGKTGFQSGVAFGGVFGNQTTRHIGGEARYTFRSNDMHVSSGSTKATAGAQSHALHYDVLVHAAAPEATVRPFVAVGGGMKYYRGTGSEAPYQPLGNLVLLTHTSEAQPLISAGGGIKFRLSNRTQLRFDFRDYMTPFPSSLLTVPASSKASGWMHDFVLMVGISGLF